MNEFWRTCFMCVTLPKLLPGNRSMNDRIIETFEGVYWSFSSNNSRTDNILISYHDISTIRSVVLLGIFLELRYCWTFWFIRIYVIIKTRYSTVLFPPEAWSSVIIVKWGDSFQVNILLTTEVDDFVFRSNTVNEERRKLTTRRRRRRQTTGMEYYDRLAMASGGQVIRTTKDEISEAVKLILVDLDTSQVRQTINYRRYLLDPGQGRRCNWMYTSLPNILSHRKYVQV